jgi:hypothetical protein
MAGNRGAFEMIAYLTHLIQNPSASAGFEGKQYSTVCFSHFMN